MFDSYSPKQVYKVQFDIYIRLVYGREVDRNIILGNTYALLIIS